MCSARSGRRPVPNTNTLEQLFFDASIASKKRVRTTKTWRIGKGGFEYPYRLRLFEKLQLRMRSEGMCRTFHHRTQGSSPFSQSFRRWLKRHMRHRLRNYHGREMLISPGDPKLSNER